MDLKVIIKSNKWTNQAMDMTPLNCDSGVYGLTAVAQKIIGDSFGVMFFYYKKGECEVYFPQNRIDKLGEVYLNQKEDIDTFYKNWLEVVKKIEEKSYKIRETDLTKFSDKKLLGWYSDIYNIFSQGWAYGSFVEVYDNTSEKIINNVLEKEKIKNKLTESEEHDLFSPAALTVVQQERLSFIKILEYIKRHYKQIKKELLLKDKKLGKMIKVHIENFFFIHANYGSADELTEKEVLDKIIKEINEANIEKELNEFEARKRECKEIPMRRKKIIEKYKLSSEIQAVSHFFSLITKWRDERKKMHQLGAVAMEKIVREIARRTGIPNSLVRYIIFKDFKNGFSGLKKMVPIFRKRAKESFLILDEFGNFSWLFGRDARRTKQEVDQTIFSQQTKTISGTPACKGRVTGIVKIVKSREAFKKFNKGDILVASMTRVEFMPVVRKAKAIVTDEGGITCHAAIVSRELGIPAIIGTKIATKVLKDGDLAEVDADKGIVKIIKRKN